VCPLANSFIIGTALCIDKRNSLYSATLSGTLCELQSQHSDVYGNFFDDGGLPKCRDEVVGRIEKKLTAHLSRLGKGAKVPGDFLQVNARSQLERQKPWAREGIKSETRMRACCYHSK
jgi:hypothetical protein